MTASCTIVGGANICPQTYKHKVLKAAFKSTTEHGLQHEGDNMSVEEGGEKITALVVLSFQQMTWLCLRNTLRSYKEAKTSILNTQQISV